MLAPKEASDVARFLGAGAVAKPPQISREDGSDAVRAALSGPQALSPRSGRVGAAVDPKTAGALLGPPWGTENARPGEVPPSPTSEQALPVERAATDVARSNDAIDSLRRERDYWRVLATDMK